MTHYLDTSSLMKLFVQEPGGDEVRQDLSEASVVATSLITYAEARATLARLRRSNSITPDGFRSAKRDLAATEDDFARDAAGARRLTLDLMLIARAADRRPILFEHGREDAQARPNGELHELGAGIDEEINEGQMTLSD